MRQRRTRRLALAFSAPLVFAFAVSLQPGDSSPDAQAAPGGAAARSSAATSSASGADVERRVDAIVKRMTLDELYDFDAGITDVYAAVAETGSLVVRASVGQGRSLSLVPPSRS